MFNGIIHNTGKVEKIIKGKKSLEFFIKTQLSFKKKEIGSSICCNGACLTLTNVKKNCFL